MADIAKLVKELRQRTGLGIGECKKALIETDGNIDEAIEVLKKYGAKVAGKKSDRDANEGIATVFANDTRCVAIEVNCETDFVARNENFVELVNKVGNIALESGAKTVEELLAVVSGDVTVDEIMKEAIGRIKENLLIGNLSVIELGANDVVGSYVHMGGKIAVATILETEGDKSDAVKSIANGLSVHISAMPVEFITEEEITDEAIEAVKTEILKNESLFAGKPEKVQEMILNNKVKDYISENCLVKHEYVVDGDKTIEELLAQTGKAIGQSVKIKSYAKLILGA